MVSEEVQRIGALTIDRRARVALIHGKDAELTNAEFTLLDVLTRSSRRAFSSDHLTREITGSDWVNGKHALQVCVSRLRVKLGESGSQPRQLITVHGFGYRFDPVASDEPAPIYSTPDGIVVQVPVDEVLVHLLVSCDRRILWISNHVSVLLGWQPDQLQDTYVHDIVHPEDRPTFLHLRRELDEGKVAAYRVRMKTVSGGSRLIDGLVRPIIGRTKEPEVFLAEWQRAGIGDPPEPTSARAIQCDRQARQRNQSLAR